MDMGMDGSGGGDGFSSMILTPEEASNAGLSKTVPLAHNKGASPKPRQAPTMGDLVVERGPSSLLIARANVPQDARARAVKKVSRFKAEKGV
jgi:hypothetical protein